MKNMHPWKLVGPWYRWHDPTQVPLDADQPLHDGTVRLELGRASRPIFQKYDSPKFIEEFLNSPQNSLRFDQTDFVHAVENGTYKKLDSNRRKVFLSTHHRHYLIVCELHCDTVGFPTVTRDQVCEAGFVVRRRSVPVPAEAQPLFESTLMQIARARNKLKSISKKSLARRTGGGHVSQVLNRAAVAVEQRESTKHHARLLESRQQLEALVAEHGVERRIDGWIPSVRDGVGSWSDVSHDEMPEEVFCKKSQTFQEHFLPLYPLVPDPTKNEHSSEGRSLWFGVLPAGTTDVDETNQPRLDDRHVYEVRCFVRRHRPECPKSSDRNDCGGELVWSQPTEPFQLASHFDLDGTSNRVVTIQLPDLNAIKAQVTSPTFKMGQGVGIAMATPRNSEVSFNIDEDGKPSAASPPVAPGSSICFFAIPLITIVAMFLLRLFLPIVVFLFQLWYLLLLKFCIPPTFSLSGGLTAELDADLDFELDVGVDFDAEIAGGGVIKDILLQDVKDNLGDHVGGKLADDTTKAEFAQMAIDMSSDFSESAPADVVGDHETDRPRELPANETRYYERVRWEATI